MQPKPIKVPRKKAQDSWGQHSEAAAFLSLSQVLRCVGEASSFLRHPRPGREAGSRVQTPTRRWSRTSYSSRAPWSPRSAHYPSPGSGWAAPRSQSAGLEESPCLRCPHATRRSPRRCSRGNQDRTCRPLYVTHLRSGTYFPAPLAPPPAGLVRNVVLLTAHAWVPVRFTCSTPLNLGLRSVLQISLKRFISQAFCEPKKDFRFALG